jgi:hypothetical protein
MLSFHWSVAASRHSPKTPKANASSMVRLCILADATHNPKALSLRSASCFLTLTLRFIACTKPCCHGDICVCRVGLRTLNLDIIISTCPSNPCPIRYSSSIHLQVNLAESGNDSYSLEHLEINQARALGTIYPPEQGV